MSDPEPTYAARDVLRARELAGRPLDRPETIGRVLDAIDYLDDWRSDYRVRSVESSLRSDRITCIDAAILAYGLLEVLFGNTKRRLLAIHRRDRKGEECGHCVALYWSETGRVGSLSKSSYPLLGHREAIHADEHAVATSYAEAYVAMGIEPLYFGVTALEDVAGELDWRHAKEPINELCDRIQTRYAYSFLLSR